MFIVVWLLALIGPRVALVFVWLFTSWVERALDGFVVPLLGFLILPWSTLAYVLVWQADGLGLIRWAIVAVGFLADIAGYASTSLRS